MISALIQRLTPLFAGLVGLAYGNPIPLEWTALPALLRMSERLVTGTAPTLAVGTIHAAHGLSSPYYLGLVALLGTLVWIAIDRQSTSMIALRQSGSVVTRYVLAAELLRHGVTKVVTTGVIFPDAVEWIRPLGEFERCEIVRLWMEYPPISTLFFGVGEALTGTLLLLRRTTSLGALLAAIAFANVMMLEIAYCGAAANSHGATYFILAGFLIYADWSRLSRFLWLGQPTSPAHLGPQCPHLRQMQTVTIALQSLTLGWLIYANGYCAVRLWTDFGYVSPLRGAYRVERFSRNGAVEPLSHESPKRWRVVAIGNFADRIAIRTIDGTSFQYLTTPIFPSGEPGWRRERASQTSRDSGRLSFIDSTFARGSAPAPDVVNYSRLEPDRLVLEGRLGGVAFTAQLHRFKSDEVSFYPWLWRQ